MKRVYNLFSLAALLLLGMVTAQAQTVYVLEGFGEDGFYDEVVPGQKFAMQAAASSTVAVFDAADPEAPLTNVVTESCLFELEEADADEGTYRLKSSQLGTYVYVFGRNGYAVVGLTSSALQADTWYVRKAVDGATDSREKSGNGEGVFVFTCASSWWPSQVVYLAGDSGSEPWVTTGTGYNGWRLYPVVEANALQTLTAVFDRIFPNGTNDEFEVGDEPGQLPQALFQALQEAYEEASALINEGNEDEAECHAAVTKLQEAYAAAQDGLVPWPEGYYFVVNHVGEQAAMYEKDGGAHFNKASWSVPETLTEADLPYVWYFEGTGTKNQFYLRNYMSGNYVNFVSSTSAVIPMSSGPEMAYSVIPFPDLKGWVALTNGTFVLHATTNGSDNVQFWDTSHQNSAWKLTRIPQEQIDAMKDALDQLKRNEELDALYKEAQAFYKSGFSYASDATPDGEFTEEPDGLVTTVEQLSTNAQEPSEGPIENLVDGDLTTFFHSAWSTAVDAKYHNLVADLGEAVEAVAFKYCGRYGGSTNGRPKTVHVYASNDGENWVDQGYVTFTYPYTSVINGEEEANFTGVTSCSFNSAYQYVRLDVEDNVGSARDSGSGQLYFYLGEFRAYKATYDAANSLVERTDATLRAELEKQLGVAAGELADEKATAESIEALRKAYEAYKAAYPDPSVLAAQIAEYEALVDAAAEGDELGYYATGSKETFDNAISGVKANLDNIVTKEQIDAARQTLTEAYAAFLAALNKPVDGKIYFLRAASEDATAHRFAFSLNNDPNNYVYLGGYSSGEGDDANINDRLNFMWKAEYQADGTLALRNVGTGNFIRNPYATSVYLRQASGTRTDSIGFQVLPSDEPGTFNLAIDETSFINAYANNSTLVSLAQRNASTRLQFTEVTEWGESYFLDYDLRTGEDLKAGQAYALTLPLPVLSTVAGAQAYKPVGLLTDGETQTLELRNFSDTENIAAGEPFVIVLDEESTSVIFLPSFNDLTDIAYNFKPSTTGGFCGTLESVALKAGQAVFNGQGFSVATDEDFSGVNTFYIDNTVKSVTEKGDYSIALAGVIETDAAVPVEFTADPADGSNVERLRVITLTFTSSSFATILVTDANPINVFDANDAVVATAPADYINNLERNQVSLRLNTNVTANGNYRIVIPAGAFNLSTGLSPEITLHYTIGADGIGSVVTGEAASRIFDLQGRRVEKAQKGIYIIGGRKVVR